MYFKLFKAWKLNKKGYKIHKSNFEGICFKKKLNYRLIMSINEYFFKKFKKKEKFIFKKHFLIISAF